LGDEERGDIVTNPRTATNLPNRAHASGMALHTPRNAPGRSSAEAASGSRSEWCRTA